MHGNVYEWCADAYAPDYYRRSPVLDPQGADGGDERVIRGGSWEGSADKCRSANRNAFNLHSRGFLLGFRVACPVPEK
jgi:formylglycine-generating enzyme required for sulfatase activity